eukprot:GHVU01143361.1.p1 GENE.GHVU01143361.1~~GHVU01143361.1.p1  ORF type:complete len:138 (-),score=8.65 GHVU01143361.1:439-852(-)
METVGLKAAGLAQAIKTGKTIPPGYGEGRPKTIPTGKHGIRCMMTGNATVGLLSGWLADWWNGRESNGRQWSGGGVSRPPTDVIRAPTEGILPGRQWGGTTAGRGVTQSRIQGAGCLGKSWAAEKRLFAATKNLLLS